MSLFDNLAYKSQDEYLTKVIEAVEEGYAAQRRPDQIMEKNSFSPSSIGYAHNRCPRYHAMRFAGKYLYKDEPSLASIGVMNNGTNAGDRIQTALQHAGIVEELEKEVLYDDPPIRGFIDAMVNINGERIVVEVKTTRTEAFQSRMISMKAPPYQMYQLLIYMYIENVERGMFLVENNNDKRLLAIPVTMTDENREAVEKVFEWMRKIWAAHENKQLPARPWKQSSPNCAGCPFFDACWSEPKEDIKLKSMTVHKW